MNEFYFFLSEAIINIRRLGLMTLISIMTITIALIILGVFFLLTANLNNLANFISSKLEIRVYLKDGLSVEEIREFQTRLAEIPEVKEIVFIDSDTAWEQFKKNFQTLELDGIIEENPLPHALNIYLRHNTGMAKTAQFLKTGFPNYIDDVGYMGVIAERIEGLTKLIKAGGVLLIGFLTIATLFIVVNTIRLTVIARQQEIEIMQLVGATDHFIRWPFIIEGVLMGLCGGITSAVILRFTYLFMATRIQESLPFIPLVFDTFRLQFIYWSVIIIGAGLGFLGAYISISKSLIQKEMLN